MAKPYKEFELLVGRIERCLQAHGGIVKSPDSVPDVDTGEKRQVDATVRIKAGSMELLCVLECRKHKDKQSVKWIEELYGRTRSLGANKIVAVTDRSMSGPAIRKAKKWGIDVRKVTSADPQHLLSWFGISHVQLVATTLEYEYAGIRWTRPREEDRQRVEAHVRAFGLYQPFMRHEPSGLVLSIEDVWRHSNKNPLREQLETSGETTLTLPIRALGDDSLFIDYPGGTVLVQQIEYTFYAKKQEMTIPPAYGAHYSDERTNLAQVLEFDLGFIREGQKLTVARNVETGDFHLATTDQLILRSI